MVQRQLRFHKLQKEVLDGFRRMNSRSVRMKMFIGALLVVIALGYFIYNSFTINSTENSIQTIGGVHRITFQYNEGNIFVFIPSDASVGDPFLQGSIEIQPSGDSESEQGYNRNALSKKALNICGQQIRISEKIFSLDRIGIADNIEVKIMENDMSQARSVNVPLLDEQPPRPMEYKLPLLVKAGDMATAIGPMVSSLNTHLQIGNLETQIVAKSPRQSTFKIPEVLGPQSYELVENGYSQSGQINVARLTVMSLNLASAVGGHKSYRWTLEGLNGLSDVGYPITILFENRNTKSSSEESTVSITQEEVMNGRVQGKKEFETAGEITASLLGADMFSRGIVASSPWSARMQPSVSNTMEISDPVDSRTNPRECKSKGTAGTCQDVTVIDITQSRTNPTACQIDRSKANPASCNSINQPNNCDSRNTPQNCGSEGKPGVCESTRNPSGCGSKEQPRNCGSKTQPTQCGSAAQPDKCESKKNPTNCRSVEVPENCDSKKNPDKCDSKGRPQNCDSENTPRNCNSAETPQNCASADKPQNCNSLNDPDKCNSSDAPQNCGTMASERNCESVNNPRKCNSAEAPDKCASASKPQNCNSTRKPENCQSTTKPELCKSVESPTQCNSKNKPENCGSNGTPENCASKTNPKQCDSNKNPKQCGSEGQPGKCYSLTQTLCHSHKIPGGGFDPCVK